MWEDETEPLLLGNETGELKATTTIAWREEQDPGRFGVSQLRSLQRRSQDRRTLHGPDQELYFSQVHPQGREAQFGFTGGYPLGVTIAGQPYLYLLFQLILSQWRQLGAEVATGKIFPALQ